MTLHYAVFLICSLCVFTHGQANYVVMPYGGSNSPTAGPDGPWWTLQQAVDYPDEIMTLLPSLSNHTLLINSSACSAQSASCPSPTPTLWSQTGADLVSNDSHTVGDEQPPTYWDTNYASLLRMNGLGSFFSQRITLHPTNDVGASYYLGVGLGLSESYSATYPGGAAYTMDTGFFSLFAAEPTFFWPDVNGFDWHSNRTLTDAYANGFIPSTSYGLHVGSVFASVPGKLVLGGYDSTRCLNAPVVSSSQTFTLTSIALNVSSGSNVYSNTSSIPITDLLRENGNAVTSLEVTPDPGVPYLYLPRDTCDAIAAHLPISYDSNYDLYFWNTTAPSYQDIISSPHYMAFSFSGSSSSSATINIPFALLTLNLTWPLVPQGTQKPYFPCSPWQPSGATGYYLGRAFLQGAFIAQNWNSSTMWMAQAPGPGGIQASTPKTIALADTTILPAVQPLAWDQTWSTLQALSDNSSNNSSSNGNGAGGSDKSHSTGISAGAIAGIVIGVVVLLALAIGLGFWLLRKRQQRAAHRYEAPRQDDVRPYYGSPGAFAPHEKNQPWDNGASAPVEAPAPTYVEPVELSGHEMQELDSTQHRLRK